MRPSKFLPISDKSLSEWAESWLISVAEDLRSVEKDLVRLRERNERFTSYLPTLTFVRTEYAMEIDRRRKKFYRENPRPDKGVTLYEKTLELELADFRHTLKMIDDIREDVATRISGSQTNIKSEMRDWNNAK